MTQEMDFFNNGGSLTHWLVVDAVRVPDIAEHAYRYEPSPELFFLFANTDFEHLIDLSPVVFTFTGSQELSDQLRDDFALRTSSVIFSFSPHISTERAQQHLHDLLTVLVNGNISFFRFYASNFWNKAALGLNDQDVNNLLGPFEQLSWIDEEKSLRFLIRNSEFSSEGSIAPFSFSSPSFVGQI